MSEKLPATTTLLKAVMSQIAPVTIRPSTWSKYRWAADFDDVEIGGDGTLCSPTGYGRTEQSAIRSLWDKVAYLESPMRLVAFPFSYRRQEWRWNGESWERLK